MTSLSPPTPCPNCERDFNAHTPEEQNECLSTVEAAMVLAGYHFDGERWTR